MDCPIENREDGCQEGRARQQKNFWKRVAGLGLRHPRAEGTTGARAPTTHASASAPRDPLGVLGRARLLVLWPQRRRLPVVVPRRAACPQAPQPNSSHFDGIGGGKRVFQMFLLAKTVFHALRGAQPLVHSLFWRQSTVWDTFGPRFLRG